MIDIMRFQDESSRLLAKAGALQSLWARNFTDGYDDIDYNANHRRRT